jgi:hypothetical protein
MTYAPLLSYSDHQDRATLVHSDQEKDEEEDPSPAEMKKTKKIKRSSKFNVNNGRISLQIPGYSGLQHLPVSKLIIHMPMKKIKIAAKKVLREMGVKKKRTRKKKKKLYNPLDYET